MQPLFLLLALCSITLTLALPSIKLITNPRQSKIVGGAAATPGQYPYTISLQDGSFGYYYHFCGGAIYTTTLVLTAASCVFDADLNNPSYLAVVAGEQTLYAAEGNEQQISLSVITLHEDFNSYSKSNDIAILTLSTALVFDSFVASINIPVQGQSSSGFCDLSGWGSSEPSGSVSNTLNGISLPLVSDTDCRTSYGEHDVEDSMICAGSAGKSGCQGDQGSPLVCSDSGGQEYLAGLGSWSYQCGTAGYPSVFVEVSYYRNWIDQNTA